MNTFIAVILLAPYKIFFLFYNNKQLFTVINITLRHLADA